VVTPPRDANGIPGVPPLTEAGKLVFAWDREQGTRPGGQKGNVLLNAHTWPDGSALGNHLLAGLQSGDRLVVHGADARLCYRVTERVEVLAERGLPRYYRKSGPSQLAIVVCSGRRLGPGIWEKRTVWFASPSV
jgi:sortase (surface protein transpeptidase)